MLINQIMLYKLSYVCASQKEAESIASTTKTKKLFTQFHPKNRRWYILIFIPLNIYFSFFRFFGFCLITCWWVSNARWMIKIKISNLIIAQARHLSARTRWYICISQFNLKSTRVNITRRFTIFKLAEFPAFWWIASVPNYDRYLNINWNIAWNQTRIHTKNTHTHHTQMVWMQIWKKKPKPTWKLPNIMLTNRKPDKRKRNKISRNKGGKKHGELIKRENIFFCS